MRFTVQNGDGWSAIQNAFILGVAQFIDTGLLLGQQPLAQDRRRCGWHAAIERAFPAQMGEVGGADHDLGRHTADIDAGAADGPALDQRDVRALLDGFQRRSHRGATAADNGDVQSTPITASLVATAQPSQRLAKQSAPH
ncbi:hypothetical protein LMG7053_01553 [Achromobacter ruhlandii]|uniref:Uncharacterized protein n=1 Tax=Achromobacter ruhlandii TaxID=72557 RepID=A0ABM8LR40_9BURK|nr:hypothetical protein LMG7053_01553 [Achromobacter ruhlandii]